MCMKVSDSHDNTPCSGDKDAKGEQVPLSLYVQEGRSAATRGLLHDFSNVMVGLCSLSENALDETEPGTALRDDMEIIRDSAVRAQQLIRRIVRLNSGEDEEKSLIEPGAWLANEAETIRATLPKGSELNIGSNSKGMLLHVNESCLRDFLLLVIARTARRNRERLRLDIKVEEQGDSCLLLLVFSGAKPKGGARPDCGEMLHSAISRQLAKQMGGMCNIAEGSDGWLTISLSLPRG